MCQLMPQRAKNSACFFEGPSYFYDQSLSIKQDLLKFIQLLLANGDTVEYCYSTNDNLICFFTFSNFVFSSL